MEREGDLGVNGGWKALSTPHAEDHRAVHVSCPQVACMQFINIVVHSVENMNFRVFLQYEFTHLGLDLYLEVSPALSPDLTTRPLQSMAQGLVRVGGSDRPGFTSWLCRFLVHMPLDRSRLSESEFSHL